MTPALAVTAPQPRPIARRLPDSLAALELGAPLYVPANLPSVADIATRGKYPHIRSVIFCTEDSIRAAELDHALRNLQKALGLLNGAQHPHVFIRVRSPHVLLQCMGMSGIEHVQGFVLPKITTSALPRYLEHFALEMGHALMLTLETREVFSAESMSALRSQLLRPEVASRILALRIGGNDLMNLMAIRRAPGKTLYATPLRHTLAALVSHFRPFGFPLSAPVFEMLGQPALLAREARQDVNFGLLPKAAIHPEQVALIERQYRVSRHDLESARAILDPARPAVFQCNGFMCEPATHGQWAEAIVQRASIFGVV